MKNEKKPHIVRNTVLAVIACGILGLVLTAVQFSKEASPTRATAVIQFSFDGAADGIAPDGDRFDIKEMASDEVLEEALEASSLSGRYTAEQIRPHLVMEGNYPEDMASQVMSYESLLNFTASRELTVTDYHPTTFGITLYNEFDEGISEADLRSLLENILTSYKAYFARVHSYHLESNALQFDLEEYDYPQQLDIIRTQLEMLEDYAQEVYEKEPSFRVNGLGFNDIISQIGTMKESDVARISADLTMNALTRNTARLLIQYQYEVRNLNNQAEKQKTHLQQLDTLVNFYEKNEIIYLSTNDALTKIDGNSSETYDVLVDQRKKVADDITQINSQITEYQLKMADLLKDTSAVTDSSAQSDNTAKAEEGNPSEAAAASAAAATPAAAGQTTPGTTAADTADGQEDTSREDAAEAGAEIAEMSEEEIAEAAEEAERLARRQIENLKTSINGLVEKKEAISESFKALLTAYNEKEINDLTVTVSRFDYKAPKIVSGDFIKKAIKTAGPVCAVGFMICMIVNILAVSREEKKRKEQL